MLLKKIFCLIMCSVDGALYPLCHCTEKTHVKNLLCRLRLSLSLCNLMLALSFNQFVDKFVLIHKYVLAVAFV